MKRKLVKKVSIPTAPKPKRKAWEKIVADELDKALLKALKPHTNCDCMACRPWTT